MSAKMQGEELIKAIKDEKDLVVDKLLQNGCDPNCRVNDVSTCTPAIIVAVTHKRFKCLISLLKSGAAVDARDKLGMTAAMYAADRGLTHYLHNLAESKADLNAVNDQGANALMLAAKWERFDCVEYLLQHISDFNRRDKDGKTALMYAAIHGSTECLHLLIGAGADLNITDSVRGFTALMHALEHNASDCASILLDKAADVNVVGWRTNSKTTALTLAFHNSQAVGEFQMIEKLLQRRADMSLSKCDQNYLHEMIARDKKKIVRLMVRNGCPPFDRRCSEYCFKFSEHKIPISPLCVALLSGYYDIAKYFIVNSFFTNYDITKLPNDPGIRQKVEENGDQRAETLAVLNLICSKPQSLKVLSFVTISEVISKVALGTRRRDNIINSGLPEPLQLELLFKKWSQICLLSWHELTIEEDQIFEKCESCSECCGEGVRVRKRRFK